MEIDIDLIWLLNFVNEKKLLENNLQLTITVI